MNSLSGLATQAARAAMNNPQSQQDGLNKGQNSLYGDPAPVLVIPSQPLFRPPTPPPAIAPPLVAPIAQPVAVLPPSVCPIAAPTPSSGSHNSSISVTSDGEKAAPQHVRVVKRGRRPKTGVERDKNGRIRKSSNKMEVSNEQVRRRGVASFLQLSLTRSRLPTTKSVRCYDAERLRIRGA